MTTKVSHPIFARFYGLISAGAEKAGAAEHRSEALAGLAGRAIELGAGNGLNFNHYPSDMTEVMAVEPEPHLRRLAAGAADRASVPARVVDGEAASLPADDESFDAPVASLVLCSVPEQAVALAELYRVIRPGGELRFYEHVRAETPRRARQQDRVDRFWPYIGGGCHTGRDTVTAIKRAGFSVEHQRRFRFEACLVGGPVAPHVVGRARRP
jgi:ubiquinone/menaquinone biosynthesis C-methylase UbiE